MSSGGSYARKATDNVAASIERHKLRQQRAAEARASSKAPTWTATRQNQSARPFDLTSSKAHSAPSPSPVATMDAATLSSSLPASAPQIGAALEARLARLQQGFVDELRRVELRAEERQCIALRAQATLLEEKHGADRLSWQRERGEMLALVGVVRSELAARDHARVTARAAAQQIVSSLAALERRMGVAEASGAPLSGIGGDNSRSSSSSSGSGGAAAAAAAAVEALGHSVMDELALFRREAASSMRRHVDETSARATRDAVALAEVVRAAIAEPLAAQRDVVERLRADVGEIRATMQLGGGVATGER